MGAAAAAAAARVPNGIETCLEKGPEVVDPKAPRPAAGVAVSKAPGAGAGVDPNSPPPVVKDLKAPVPLPGAAPNGEVDAVQPNVGVPAAGEPNDGVGEAFGAPNTHGLASKALEVDPNPPVVVSLPSVMC